MEICDDFLKISSPEPNKYLHKIFSAHVCFDPWFKMLDCSKDVLDEYSTNFQKEKSYIVFDTFEILQQYKF